MDSASHFINETIKALRDQFAQITSIASQKILEWHFLLVRRLLGYTFIFETRSSVLQAGLVHYIAQASFELLSTGITGV